MYFLTNSSALQLEHVVDVVEQDLHVRVEGFSHFLQATAFAFSRCAGPLGGTVFRIRSAMKAHLARRGRRVDGRSMSP